MSISSSPIPAGEGRLVVEARDGDRVVGRLRARRTPSALLIPDAVEAEGAEGPVERDVVTAFARALATDAAASGHDVLVVEKPSLAPLAAALIEAGLVVRRRKVFVARDLSAPIADVQTTWERRPLATIGDAAMIERMAVASEGDPFEERKGAQRDYEREWRELVASARAHFDPARWLAIDDATGPVGVVLPQLIRTGLGTLFYVGVVPARRREGHGTALHRFGLSLVQALGATRYVGSTDVQNVAMRRVFERNECAVEGTEAYFGHEP